MGVKEDIFRLFFFLSALVLNLMEFLSIISPRRARQIYYEMRTSVDKVLKEGYKKTSLLR